MASTQSSGYTICVIGVKNNISIDLDQNRYWQGYGDPLAHIGAPKPRPAPSTFTHKADFVGSIGGLTYDVHNDFDPQPMPPKWIIAWSNEKGMPNKVYTKIFAPDEHIDWHKIKDRLDRSGPTSSDGDDRFGFKAEAEIDPRGDTPTMRATLTVYKAA